MNFGGKSGGYGFWAGVCRLRWILDFWVKREVKFMDEEFEGDWLGACGDT